MIMRQNNCLANKAQSVGTGLRVCWERFSLVSVLLLQHTQMSLPVGR